MPLTALATRFLTALLLGGCLFSLTPVHAASGPESQRVPSEIAYRTEPLPLPRLLALTAQEMTLPPVSAERLQQELPESLPAIGAPLKIGFSRTIGWPLQKGTTNSALDWQRQPDGSLAALISLRSPDALGLRLGLRVENLPDSAELRFWGATPEQAYATTGRDIMTTLLRNRNAGDRSDESGTYWTPLIDGDQLHLQIRLPGSVEASAARFTIDRLAHQFASPLDTRTLLQKIGQSSPCHLDAQCYTSTWGNESRSTAKITFMNGGSSYVCTGTLINDADPATQVPYFLTANHCISTQTEASTLHSYWFYQSSACNSGSLNPASQTLTGGATLLYASPASDTSFLRLNAQPPAGAVFTGWSASSPLLSSQVTGIHNPGGDLQKISFGTLNNFASCTTGTSDSYNCFPASDAQSSFIEVNWNQGITEGGSSGSGLWMVSGGQHYLIGQLRGGSSFCGAFDNTDQYGRFDVAYNAALKQWLSGSTACSYTLSATDLNVDAAAGTRTVTVATSGGCSWSASSNSDWITFSGNSSGAGSGSVTLSLAANTSVNSRTGTVTIAGQALTLTQAGSSCSASLSPTQGTLTSQGGSGTVTLKTGCAWTASSNASWITLTSATSGSGNAVLSYSVAANSGSSTRYGTLTIAGQVYTIVQNGSGGGGSTPLLNDSGFEDGNVWAEFSSGGYTLTTTGSSTVDKVPVLAHSGSHFGYLGGYNEGLDVLSQTLTLPADAQGISLQFWYWISTDDLPTEIWDTLSVELYSESGTLLTTLANFSNLDANTGWTQTPAIDLTPYKGQRVSLIFTGTTDTFFASKFFIDDILLTAESSSQAVSTVTVYEFYHAGLSHYFRTADPAEATAIDNGAAGAGWSRTGDDFKAYPAGSSGAPVCRFYGSLWPGPNSHFYTASQSECDGLKALQASTPDTEPRWNYEGIAFNIVLPDTNGCSADTQPVYRLYNRGYEQGMDANHRFTTLAGAYQSLQATGWAGESVVLCAPQ